MYEIAEYDLEVDSPYGVPSPKEMRSAPDALRYPQSKIRWNHLGKNVQALFTKAIAETDESKIKGYAQVLGLYMKIAYKNYHDETVTDEAVKEELLRMSNGKLVFEANEFRKHVDGTLSESAQIINIRNHRMNENMANQGGKNRNQGGNRNFKQNRYGRNFRNKR
jgi:hypothetical protein